MEARPSGKPKDFARYSVTPWSGYKDHIDSLPNDELPPIELEGKGESESEVEEE